MSLWQKVVEFEVIAVSHMSPHVFQLHDSADPDNTLLFFRITVVLEGKFRQSRYYVVAKDADKDGITHSITSQILRDTLNGRDIRTWFYITDPCSPEEIELLNAEIAKRLNQLE